MARSNNASGASDTGAEEQQDQVYYPDLRIILDQLGPMESSRRSSMPQPLQPDKEDSDGGEEVITSPWDIRTETQLQL